VRRRTGGHRLGVPPPHHRPPAPPPPRALRTRSERSPPPVPRHNMFFFLSDQHRVDTLPCYGNDIVSTPWLDTVAADGTVFDRFYTPTAICTPARASLLTGEAPFRHQLLANYERNVGYKEDLDPGQRAFSRDLREHGYNVGLAGKWHVG